MNQRSDTLDVKSDDSRFKQLLRACIEYIKCACLDVNDAVQKSALFRCYVSYTFFKAHDICSSFVNLLNRAKSSTIVVYKKYSCRQFNDLEVKIAFNPKYYYIDSPGCYSQADIQQVEDLIESLAFINYSYSAVVYGIVMKSNETTEATILESENIFEQTWNNSKMLSSWCSYSTPNHSCKNLNKKLLIVCNISKNITGI
jgi:hypothetical protein